MDIFPPCNYSYSIHNQYTDTKKINNLIINAINSHSNKVIIIKDNKTILSLENNKTGEFIQSYSITKSFIALAIMFLIQDKLLLSTNVKVDEFIPFWRFNNKKKNITIHHLLIHTSGLSNEWNYDDFIGYNIEEDTYTDVNSRAISSLIKVDNKLGTKWKYNNIAFSILCTIIKSITDKEVDQYLNEKLFAPLNIKYKWEKDALNQPYGPFGLAINYKDYIKIGELILNKGVYKDKVIIKNKYLKMLFKNRIRTRLIKKDKDHNPFYNQKNIKYAYGWWSYKKCKFAMGYLGQYFIINKKKKIIALRFVDPLWKNKLFIKAVNDENIHFKNFINMINEI